MAEPRILKHTKTEQEVYNKEYVDKLLKEEVIPEPAPDGVPKVRVRYAGEAEGQWEEVVQNELVAEKHWFASPQERDDYFSDFDDELVDGLRVAVEMDPPTVPATYYISRYSLSDDLWTTQIALGRGPKGNDGLDGIPGEPADDGELHGRVRQSGMSSGVWLPVVKYVQHYYGLTNFPQEGDSLALYIDQETENLYRWSELDNDYIMVSAEAEPNLHFGRPFPAVGNEHHLYIDTDENVVYRWDTDAIDYISLEVKLDITPFVSLDTDNIIEIENNTLKVLSSAAVSADAGNLIHLGSDNKLKVEDYRELVVATEDTFPSTGDVERLYIATDTNKFYRWDVITKTEYVNEGTATIEVVTKEEKYVEVSADPLFFGATFPEVGKADYLYVNTAENAIYRWDATAQEYVATKVAINISNFVSEDADNIVAVDNNKIAVKPADAISADSDNTMTLGSDNKLKVADFRELNYFDTYSNFPATGQDCCFYIAKDTDKLYRWATITKTSYVAEGTAMIEVTTTETKYVEVSNAVVIPHDSFPQEGVEGKIYVNTDGQLAYIWDNTLKVFKQIGVDIDRDDEENVAQVAGNIISVYPRDMVSEQANNGLQISAEDNKIYFPITGIDVNDIIDDVTEKNAVENNSNKIYVKDLTDDLGDQWLFRADEPDDPDDPDEPVKLTGALVNPEIGQETYNVAKLDEKFGACETVQNGLNTRLTSAEGTITNIQSNQAALQTTVAAQGTDISALKTMVPELESVPFDPYDLHSDENPSPAAPTLQTVAPQLFDLLDSVERPDVWIQYFDGTKQVVQGWWYWKNDGSGQLSDGWNYLAVEDSETGKIRSKNTGWQIPTTDSMENTIDSKISTHRNASYETAHPYIRATVDQCSKMPTFANNVITFTSVGGATQTVDLTQAAVFQDVYYDDQTEELVFVLVSDPTNPVRVPMGDLVPVFSGALGDNIQVSINNNEISATLLDGTIVKEQLHPDLQLALESVPSTANFVTINSEQIIRATKTFNPTNSAAASLRAAYIAPVTDASAMQIGTAAASVINFKALETNFDVSSGKFTVDAWQIKMKQSDDTEPLQIGDDGTPEILIQAQRDTDSKITIDAPEVNFNGGRITNIAPPADPQDVVTSGYVEEHYIPRGATYPLLLKAADENIARSLSAANPANIYYVE